MSIQRCHKQSSQHTCKQAAASLRLPFCVSWQDAIPWAALLYVTGQINYGGRVTDNNDRVLLTQLLTRCYTPAALAPGFTPAEGYPLPAADASLEACLGHIQGLPAVDTAHVFNMHPNADTAFQLQVMPLTATAHTLIHTVEEPYPLPPSLPTPSLLLLP